MSVLQGKVKFFNETKGFGFIAPDGGGNDVFVHITELKNSHLDGLSEGDIVSFTKGEGRGGKSQAENIEIVS